MLAELNRITLPGYYYLAPLWRRLVIIGVLGVGAFGLTFAGLEHLAAERSVHPGVYLFLVLLSGFLLLLLRARIRVDENGIARRRLIGWKVYPWHLFSQQEPPTLCVGETLSSGAGFQMKRLHFTLLWLAATDHLQLHRLLTPEGTRVHLPEVPRRVRVQVFGLKWLEMDEHGLVFDADGDLQQWSWDDVKCATITKESHGYTRIESARLELTDRTFNFISSNVECDTGCRCRPDYLLQRFLWSVLRKDQRLIVSKNRMPETVAEAEYHVRALRRDLRSQRIIKWGWCIAILILLVLWLRFDVEMCGEIALQLIAISVICGPILWGANRQKRKHLQMLEAYLAEHTD